MSKVQLAKVKRVMQDVEGTGQVPKQVIQSMVDLVELFVDDVVERAAESVKNTGAQAQTPATLDEKVLHAIVENEKSFDFLRGVRVVVPAVAYKPRSKKRRRTKEDASDAEKEGSENGQEEKTFAESGNDGTYKLPPLAEEPLSLTGNAASGQSGDASSDDEYD